MYKLHARGDFESDSHAAQVHIPARWDGRAFFRLDGAPLPPLRPGALVSLRTNAGNLLDDGARVASSQTSIIPLLPEGHELYALVDLRGLYGLRREPGPQQSWARHHHDQAVALRMGITEPMEDRFQAHDGAAALRLLEPLRLFCCGDKPLRRIVVPQRERPGHTWVALCIDGVRLERLRYRVEHNLLRAAAQQKPGAVPASG